MTAGRSAHSNFQRRTVGILAGVLLVCADTPAFAQKLGQAPDDGISFVRVLAALLLCLAIAVAAAIFLQKRAGLGLTLPSLIKRHARLKLVESLRVSPQVNVCIVTCDGRELLLEVSPQGASILAPLAARNTGDEPS